MRLCLLLLASTTLAACGGAGPGSGVASSSSNAPSGGTSPSSGHSFVNPTEVKTYEGIGVAHSFAYKNTSPSETQSAQLYQGDATTARSSGISLTYNPRDAIFDLTINQSRAVVSTTNRFQDPAHRVNFGGLSEPQVGVPNIAGQGIQYLEAGSESGTRGQSGYSYDVKTFFYQKPGTTTNYVTYAGFVRNQVSTATVTPVPGDPSILEDSYTLQRAAFVFGERSATSAVPRSGNATFNGAMLATMVFNPLIDTSPNAPTYFQWINGTAQARLNFGANSFALDLNGTTSGAFRSLLNPTTPTAVIANGATFVANASGRIDLVAAGGFLGQFQTARFTNPDGTIFNVTIGGSSVDGTFFGPTAQEVGGSFRIVGGVPDERIDILGVFTGR